jgi:predicted nuclease with RNAse H fold
MEFSEKIDNFSYYLGAVYIDNEKAFVQSVTSSSRVFFATVKRVRTVGVDAPFGPIQRRLSFAYKGFPSVLFYA